MQFDPSQQAVLDSTAPVLRVLGAPGTGKTTLAVEVVAQAVRTPGVRADACLLLTASRSAAAELRQQVTARLGGTSTESLARTWQAFGFGMAFHALAVLEVFFTLGLIQPDAAPTLSQSVVFEAFNRVQMLAFKFVPFRVGVDEALTGALAPALDVPAAVGVALAIVRKVRNLFWAGLGLALMGGRARGRRG